MNKTANILTVDLEEWFVVEALADHIHHQDWSELPSTLEANTDRLLRLLKRTGVTATFFVVGWCAERYPDVIRRIAEAGHEIGCHSYRHLKVSRMTPESFRDDVRRAVEIIVDACGVRPRGYRAPSWSIDESASWAFEVLADLRFEYDSSIFPIKHDLYGMPNGPRSLFRMSLGDGRYLYELPASTYRLFGQNFPVGGGGYLRHSPYWYTRWVARRMNRSGQPLMVYLHPWELDPEPPPVAGLSPVQRFRTYGSTRILEERLSRLLEDFRFVSMQDYIYAATRHRIGFEH
jgi:polysaccharide deacetylase family protein (PEP-CTERM system associated)